MNIFTKLRLNLHPIFICTVRISFSILSFIAIVFTFISLSDLGITDIWVKIAVLVSIVILSFLFATLWIVFLKRRSRLWSKGKNQLYAMYGDLLKYAFKTSEKYRRIIVIPVNDTFETIVESGGEKISKPLIAASSLHGIWIEKIKQHLSISHEDLNDRILKNLELNGYKPSKTYTRQEKERGNLLSFPIGTIAAIDGDNNTTFYLLAISTFDKDNNAISSKSDIKISVECLLDYYNKKGQGESLYLPLLGTGISRANISHEQSLKYIKYTVLSTDEKINGCITVIVYTKDEDKVSIYK